MSEKTRIITIHQEQPQTKGRLVPSQGDHPPVQIDGIVTLGRDPANDIVVFDPHVSLFHCQFEKRPNGYFVRDLKSSNGVYVNGARVVEAHLDDASIIRVGKLEFIFRSNEIGTSQIEIPLDSKNLMWKAQIERIPSIAQSDVPVFLHGESGSGKEVIARLIHDLSMRSQGPFVVVNCSALAESLAESELFGHVKGSFTGAAGDRKGAFEAARNGTLFLDEIGDLPMALQPKLLRALESQEIKPVGSDKTITTNVRIVSATHKHLKSLVEKGTFREDLFFRINVVNFYIPPLRERLEDFEDLLNQFATEYKVNFSTDSVTALKNRVWSGNIRELKNFVARAKALIPDGLITSSAIEVLFDTTRLIEPKRPAKKKGRSLESRQLEKERLIQALRVCGGNQRRAAIHLNIPKSTLHDRVKAYNIDPKSLLHSDGLEKDTFNSPAAEDFVQSSAHVNFKL